MNLQQKRHCVSEWLTDCQHEALKELDAKTPNTDFLAALAREISGAYRYLALTQVKSNSLKG